MHARPHMFLNWFFAALAVATVLFSGAAEAAQPLPWQLGLQEAASPVMAAMTSFHTFLLVIITVITLFVLALLIYVVVRYNQKSNPTATKTSHNTLIEIVWTVVPVIILVIIAIPSFRILYYQQTIPDADVTVKAIGASWYWEYEYPDHEDVAFSSLMLTTEEERQERAQKFNASIDEYPRLLAVDYEMVVPVNKVVRVIVTSNDVLHSFALPAFGVKKDAVQGRLNQTWFMAEKEGLYYGQCSQLCGVNHAYMPVAIRVVSEEAYEQWLAAAADDIDEANAILASMAHDEKKYAQVTAE